MGRRSKKNIVIENLRVEGMAAEGKCIAHHNDLAVFIKKAAPGDLIDLQVTRKKKSFLEGVPIKFHELSDKRVEPICEYFGTCGGCKWQHIDYKTQIEYKQQQVIDSLERIAKVPLPEITPIKEAKETSYYRNKLEYTFTANRWLTTEQIQSDEDFDRRGVGFHVPNMFDKIIDINHCHLQAEPSNSIRNFINSYAKEHDLSFYDIRGQKGLLRNLIIRNSNLGQVMVILQLGEDNEVIPSIMEAINIQFPDIYSLNYVINTKGNETFFDLDIVNYKGENFINEQLGELTYKIGPKSFYQTNSAQAFELYSIAKNMISDLKNKIVYDLYTGTGSIANFIAQEAKKVIGIEYVPEAIEDAKLNSELNNIKNTIFYAGDMKDLLTDNLTQKEGIADIIITDPPRAGMHEDVVHQLLKISAPEIIYISCNPATQARDIELLGRKYKVKAVHPVDMFPHTHHVENVVHLQLK